MMYAGGSLVLVGMAMQVLAWWLYRRDYPRFRVARPIWYFLYPRGAALFIVGVWVALAGLVLYAKA